MKKLIAFRTDESIINNINNLISQKHFNNRSQCINEILISYFNNKEPNNNKKQKNTKNTLKRIDLNLSRVPNNLNQIAYHLNKGNMIDKEEIIININELAKYTKEIRRLLKK